ncbi:adiponectin receptor protein 2-like [Sycon ciliatum]|uniref:adiponectin receptor protein 2-like n=1 Tax=Sycon ciliatum TaxID=27933 RepID=UPI0031F6C20E
MMAREKSSQAEEATGSPNTGGVKKSRSLVLVPFDALPDWLKDNNYLLTRHRSPTGSFSQCAKSIFRLHTETMNIWTHILGSLAFVALGVFWYIDFYPSREDILRFHPSKLPWQEQLSHLLFLGSAVLCMGFSAIFHTVSAHSSGVAKIFSRLDYSGIAILITGSNIMWYYYAFYCHDEVRSLYTYFIVIFGSLCVVVSMWSKFSMPGYHRVRGFIFLGLGLMSLVPVFHVLSLYGWTVACHNVAMMSLIYMGISYVSGAIIYMLRVPERFFPGKCDIVLHSHTIFHILVFIGCLLTYDSMHTMAFTRYLKNLRGLTSCNTIILESGSVPLADAKMEL